MAEKTTTALTVKDQTLDALSKRIRKLEDNGEIQFPENYSPQNALKSAWLILQETEDRNHKPALDVCTTASISNALFDMVILGLNPAKKQGYMIVYGKKLAFQPSYFGHEALAKRVDPDIKKIVAEVVYQKDELEYEIVLGEKVISGHKQKLENVKPGEIVAAYCLVINQAGEVKASELMTIDEIKASWKMSKMNPVDNKGNIVGKTHSDFTAEMCKKTVINRTCKPIINSSNDSYLKAAASRAQVVQAEEETADTVEELADQEIIDIDDDEEAQEEEVLVAEEEEPPPVDAEIIEEAEKPKPKPKPAPKKKPESEKAVEEPPDKGQNTFVFCPDTHKRTAIVVCEEKCDKFSECEAYQKAVDQDLNQPDF